MISSPIPCPPPPPETQAPSGETENLRNLRLEGRTWCLGGPVSARGLGEVAAEGGGVGPAARASGPEMNCFLVVHLKAACWEGDALLGDVSFTSLKIWKMFGLT